MWSPSWTKSPQIKCVHGISNAVCCLQTVVSPAMVPALWQGGGYGGRRAAFIGADRLGAELGGAHQPPAQHQPPTTNHQHTYKPKQVGTR